MRVFIFFIVLIIKWLNLSAQKITITGIILNEHLEPVMLAEIMDSDSSLLGRSDMKGKFELHLSPEINKVLIADIGYEWKTIVIPKDCNHLEVFLLDNVTYDFRPLFEINRLRKKRFKKLPKLFKEAYAKKIFVSEKPCYKDEFVPYEW